MQVKILYFLFFLLNLLGWNWFTKLYRFQVYNSTKHHLHTHCFPITQPKAKPLFIPIPPTALPTSTYPQLHMYFAYSLHLLSSSSPILLPSTAVSPFSVSLILFLFCLLVYFVHHIPHVSEIIWYLSFSDWLISLNIVISRSIHAFAKGKTFFFFMTV